MNQTVLDLLVCTACGDVSYISHARAYFRAHPRANIVDLVANPHRECVRLSNAGDPRGSFLLRVGRSIAEPTRSGKGSDRQGRTTQRSQLLRLACFSARVYSMEHGATARSVGSPFRLR